MAMKISEAVEASDKVVEVNDANKEECKRCEQKVVQAQQNVAKNQNQLNNAQAVYGRAVAARNRAYANAENDEEGDNSRLQEYDELVREAEQAVQQCESMLENARYLEATSQNELSNARTRLDESSQQLEYLEAELENIQDEYANQISIVQQLQGTMFDENIAGVVQQLTSQGMLAASTRQKILASLGRSASVSFSDMGGSGGGGGGRSMGGRVKSLYTSTSINHGGGSGGGFAGGGFDGIGSSESVGAYSQGPAGGGSGSSSASMSGAGGPASSSMTPQQALSKYMNDHNYGRNDYATYALDPEWQRLHREAFPSHYPDTASIANSLPQGNFGHLNAQQSTIRENSYTFTGNGNSAYNAIMNDLGSYTVNREGYGDRGVIRTVDPSLIEGIEISSHEFETPGNFWSHHNREGTEESFLEIASRIPEVQRLLDNGASLDSILENERLGNTARIYFDTNSSEFPTVVEGNGFYGFESNGRHRILAARMLGHNIPVRVIGRYSRK